MPGNISYEPGALDDIKTGEDFVSFNRVDSYTSANDLMRFRDIIGGSTYGPGEFLPGDIWYLFVTFGTSSENFDDFNFAIASDSATPDGVKGDEVLWQTVVSDSSDDIMTVSMPVSWEMVENSFNEDIQVRVTSLDDSGANVFVNGHAIRVKRGGDPERATTNSDGTTGESFD